MRNLVRATLLLGLVVAACSEETTAPSPDVRLVEAGWSFGFCLGACRGELELAADGLVYRVSNRQGDQVLAENRGRLTEAGAARLSARLAGLPEALQDRYGCPDCADAGASYVVLSRDAVTQRVEYEYPNPPAELASLDTFLKGVMDALGTCQATADVALVGACTPAPR